MMESKKKGRPSKNGGKTIRLNIRIDSSDMKLIKDISERTGQSVSEIVRTSIMLRHNVMF